MSVRTDHNVKTSKLQADRNNIEELCIAQTHWCHMLVRYF